MPTDRIGAIFSESWVCPESIRVVALTVKLKVPDAVGLPVIAPADVKLRPGGKGLRNVQVQDSTHPVAVNCTRYGVLTVPPGRIGGPLMTTSAWSWEAKHTNRPAIPKRRHRLRTPAARAIWKKFTISIVWPEHRPCRRVQIQRLRVLPALDFNASARPSSITHPIPAENSGSRILINS